MCEKVTRPCIKALSRSLALEAMTKLVSNLITLVLSLVFFGGVNAGGGDKDQKNESDKKTGVECLSCHATCQTCITFCIELVIPRGYTHLRNQRSILYCKFA